MSRVQKHEPSQLTASQQPALTANIRVTATVVGGQLVRSGIGVAKGARGPAPS